MDHAPATGPPHATGPTVSAVAEATGARDVLVVELGRRGLRARRTGRAGPNELTGEANHPGHHPGHHSGQGDAEPDLETRLDVPSLRAGSPVAAADLAASVGPLLGEGVPPPAATVWAIAELARTVDATALLPLVEATVRSPRCVVVDGAVATLAGAFDEVTPGVVLDMGAGVSALATDFDRTWHRIDGWGLTLGDRGSAAWLGAQGLAAALRHRDGVPGGSAALFDAGRRAFGDEHGWSALLAEHTPAAVCADFAPVVGEVARRDGVAEGICRLAGEHLADTICAGAAVLPGRPLAATGGLLLIEAVKVAFAAALAQRRVILVPALGDALAGARLLAAHLIEGERLPHRPPFVHVAGRQALGS